MPPQLRAGVSRAVTTPPVGIAHPFWGAQTHTRAEGVDLDLWTTVLVVSDGATTAAIVDSDLPNVPDSLSAEVRRRSAFAVTMVSGYSNGEIGYVPMRSDYKNGGYGVWNSPLAPGSAEMLIEAASDLLEAASGR